MPRYIISHHRFTEHATVESVRAELKRLRRKNPGQDYSVYQVKFRYPAHQIEAAEAEAAP
jgi:hypothetical protein